MTLRTNHALRWGSLALTATLVLGGCTSKPADTSATAAPSGGTSTVASPSGATTETTTTSSAPATTASPAPSAAASVPGATPEISAVIAKLYLGGDVPASDTAASVIGGRKPVSEMPKSEAHTGEWQGQPVSVVQAGDDVTLLVKADGAWKVVGGWWPSLGTDSTFTSKRFVTLLGSDARPGQDILHQRADALHIIGFDGNDGAGFVGFARDTWTRMPTGRMAKLNNAMVIGGPRAQLRSLTALTGIPLSEYILIDFQGFIKMVNGVGGMDLTLPRYARHAGLPVGTHRLDGRAVLRWARERKGLPRGDFDRSHNQDLIMGVGAVVLRGKGPGALPWYLTEISKHVHTNMDAEQALTFFAEAFRVDPDKVGYGTSAGGIGTSSGGASIVIAGSHERALWADLADGNVTPR